MVSKQKPGQGDKDTKKSAPVNEKQKAGSNQEQAAAVSKPRKGRKGKDTPATALRADQSWPPKPWIKKHRDGKNQCYANPRTGQEFYTEADLERYLAYLARVEAEKTADLDVSNTKFESNETPEMTISNKGANAERITQDEVAPEVVVVNASNGVEDLDYFFKEIESKEGAEANRMSEQEDVEWVIIDGDEILPVIAVDHAPLGPLSDFLMSSVESYTMAEASTSGEKALVEGVTEDVSPEDEEFARERKRKGKEAVKICDKCNKENCKCRPKDGPGIPRGGINIRQT